MAVVYIIAGIIDIFVPITVAAATAVTIIATAVAVISTA
jgi:hypothetical protein